MSWNGIGRTRSSVWRGDSDHDGQERALSTRHNGDRESVVSGPAVAVMARGGRSGSGQGENPRGIVIEGEPDPLTGTVEDWQRYRDRLAALPQSDSTVRLAIAVAEARIDALHRATPRRGPADGSY